jgi:SH3 domain protein
VKIFALLIAGLLLSGEVFSQQTIYIRDMLYVPMRSGQGTQYRIVHKGLVSGTPLAVLELSEDNTYTKVRTPKGTEGWVQSQYLSKEPSARNQLKLAKIYIASLHTDNDALS